MKTISVLTTSLGEFFKNILDTSDWPARWHCGKWTEFHGWLYIISDLLIWAAYFAIPIIIIRFISRKKHAKFIRLYFLFAAFILACGATHFMDAVMFWYPAYRLSALLRLITAVVSWVTILNLLKVLPFAFSLKTNEEFEAEIEQRQKTEIALKQKNEQLGVAEVISCMGHWRWNMSTGDIFWSENLKKIYGFTDQPGYDQYMERIHPQDKELLEKNIKDIIVTGDFKELYHRIITTGGKEKIIHVRGDVMKGPGGIVTEMFGTAQDVTGLMETQMALEKKTKELEALNFELDKFNHVASHDLQEPLRKIATYGQLLNEQLQQKLDEKSQAYLSRIVSASRRITDMINSIVSFSLVKRQEVAFAPTDLNMVIKNVVDDLELKIQRTGAVVHVDKLPVIDANAPQLEQLFQNLISNAIKFQDKDKSPFIKIHAEPLYSTGQFFPGRTQDTCTIVVEDNGIGFEEKYQSEIFDLFNRINNKFEGTGLGLAICKKIVDNHNGSIYAESSPGKGSKFIIELPLYQRGNVL